MAKLCFFKVSIYSGCSSVPDVKFHVCNATCEFTLSIIKNDLCKEYKSKDPDYINRVIVTEIKPEIYAVDYFSHNLINKAINE